MKVLIEARYLGVVLGQWRNSAGITYYTVVYGAEQHKAITHKHALEEFVACCEHSACCDGLQHSEGNEA